MDLPSEMRVRILEYVIPKQITVQMPTNTWPANPIVPFLLLNSTIKAEAHFLPKPRLMIRFGTTPKDRSAWDGFTTWFNLPASHLRKCIHGVESFYSSVTTLGYTDDYIKQGILDCRNAIEYPSCAALNGTEALLWVFHSVKLLVSEGNTWIEGDDVHVTETAQWEASGSK